jgi:regulator of protease activity HflC (stomatin/prohibitin superfamily)
MLAVVPLNAASRHRRLRSIDRRPTKYRPKSMKFFVLMVLSSLLTACSVYSPDAGHEVVLVEKPWFFGHGGVDPDPVKPGRTFAAFSTEGVDVYMQPMKAETEMHDTMTSDGVPISFHAIMVLQVTDSVSLIKNFGRDWYKNNLEEQFKTMVRQAVRKRGMNETAISTTALDAIDEEIRQALIAFIKEKGLPVKLITMTVGRANPPDAIKNQRIETATQEQRIQTEQQTKLAEIQRKSAEEARAAADNAYRQAIGLSPEQYVQLKRIEMEQRVCADGKCTFIENSGALPVFGVK